MVSPPVAMDHRRSSKPVKPARSEAVNSIQRVGTGARRSSRNRSASRTYRSHTLGALTSTASSKKDDEWHESLFWGAALIQEQLIRSLASANQAVDEAERDFREDMIERRIRRQKLWATQLVNAQSEEEDNREDMDLDFSRIRIEGDAVGPPIPGIDRGRAHGAKAGVRSAASQSSSTLEAEGHRLDNLMSILANNSSVSSSSPGVNIKRLSSEKENISGGARRSNNVSPAAQAIAMHDVTSPTLTLDLNSPTAQFVSQSGNIHDGYAGRYFHEDALKPVAPTSEPSCSAGDGRAGHNRQDRSPGEDVEALIHAREAGPLWRSLVGSHVRFPPHWETVLPSALPPMYSRLNKKWSKWYYVARHRVEGDKRLTGREFGVCSRRSGGRILMRLIVREMHTEQVRRDVAIGCFHPNTRGIRKGDPSPDAEDVREVWMAVRWMMATDEDEPTPDLREEGGNYEGVVDSFLMKNRKTLDYAKMGSALGHRKAVNNENVRAVFGDQPPMTTVDLYEDEVAQILKSNGSRKLADLPALMLLKLFLLSK